jgi:hypothetical protein
MTREEKDLLLKDLCARLPYGVKVRDELGRINKLVIGNADLIRLYYNDFSLYSEKKLSLPYLFPLSSLTEEQLKEMQEIIGNPNEACISVNTSGLELWLNSIDTDPTIWLDTIFEVQNWLNKNHFDYRGLIEKGLALDATNLNIY